MSKEHHQPSITACVAIPLASALRCAHTAVIPECQTRPNAKQQLRHRAFLHLHQQASPWRPVGRGRASRNGALWAACPWSPPSEGEGGLQKSGAPRSFSIVQSSNVTLSRPLTPLANDSVRPAICTPPHSPTLSSVARLHSPKGKKFQSMVKTLMSHKDDQLVAALKREENICGQLRKRVQVRMVQ